MCGPSSNSCSVPLLKSARPRWPAHARRRSTTRQSTLGGRSQRWKREAAQAAIRQLVESVRSLDAATTLSDVLDALAVAVRHQAARAAVLVIRQDRLVGWKLAGFGASDAQPRTVDFGLTEGDVVGVAVQAGRTVSTGENGARSPAFAGLSPSRSGLAMPVTVGGRVVAVVYADGNGGDAPPPDVSTTWSERLELLTRHAARCLEALTVQKTVSAAAPRFWMQTPGRSSVTA
jgi:hypothetical protein